MKHVDVKHSLYIDSDIGNNNGNPKFKVDDHIRIPKYKSIFCRRLCSKLVRRKKLKILCCGYMSLVILTEKKLFERFMKKNCKSKSNIV